MRSLYENKINFRHFATRELEFNYFLFSARFLLLVYFDRFYFRPHSLFLLFGGELHAVNNTTVNSMNGSMYRSNNELDYERFI